MKEINCQQMLLLFEQTAGTRLLRCCRSTACTNKKKLSGKYRGSNLKKKKKEEPLTRPSPPVRVSIFQGRLVDAKAIALL